MELDDQPIAPKLFQSITKTKKSQSWAQETADELEKEENDAGMPHELHKFSMNEIHSMSHSLDFNPENNEPAV